MKKFPKYTLHVAAGSIFLAIFSTAFLFINSVYAQEIFDSLTTNKQQKIQADKADITLERPRYVVKPTSSARLSANSAIAAASANKFFKYDLSWNFGKKTQRGWFLYEHLVRRTIETEAGSESAEFAIALAEWQQKNSLLPTGILDKETFGKMVEAWQLQRLGKRGTYASEEMLVDAPISDFYDSTRDPSLLKVERQTYAAYKKMVAAAAQDLRLKTNKNGELAADEPFLKIISAFRSREYQEKLRKQSPESGTAGLAINSPHFTGQALDIYVGGEPVITKDFNRAVQIQTPAYKWLVKNAHRFGFYPYFYEPWHWEYVPQNANVQITKTN